LQENKIGLLFKTKYIKNNLFQNFNTALRSSFKSAQLVFLSFKILITGKAHLNELAGPIGIIQIASFQFNQGFFHFLEIIALINISLGIINLLPIPVLDGGHLFFILIEAIFRKPPPKKLITIFNNTFSLILFSLMFFILLNDLFFWPERVALLKNLVG
jgi:regulator of sigma E protease